MKQFKVVGKLLEIGDVLTLDGMKHRMVLDTGKDGLCEVIATGSRVDKRFRRSAKLGDLIQVYGDDNGKGGVVKAVGHTNFDEVKQ